MTLQPDVVTADVVEEAIAEADPAKTGPALDRVRFETFTEGRAAQALHIGPYAGRDPPSASCTSTSPRSVASCAANTTRST